MKFLALFSTMAIALATDPAMSVSLRGSSEQERALQDEAMPAAVLNFGADNATCAGVLGALTSNSWKELSPVSMPLLEWASRLALANVLLTLSSNARHPKCFVEKSFVAALMVYKALSKEHQVVK